MKRQRAFLQASQAGVKKPRLSQSLAVSQVIPRPLGLSQVQKAQINKMILSKEEVKYFDVRINSVTYNTTPTDTILTQISQGVNVQNRIGNKIRLLGFKFRLMCYASTDTINLLRITFWQYSGNSANYSPTAPNLFENGSSNAALTPQPDSQYNWAQRKTYKVQYDTTLGLSPQATPVVCLEQRVSIPKKWQDIVFNSDAATTGTNHLLLTVMSDSAAVPHPEIDGTIRLFYTDA